AVAGVKKKEPATMVRMKGRPKRRNGCRCIRDRYAAARRSCRESGMEGEEGRNLREENVGMAVTGIGVL
ncbi:MAG: hypothetical protein Q9197_004194, partial [Variospora fuerteventurae]